MVRLFFLQFENIYQKWDIKKNPEVSDSSTDSDIPDDLLFNDNVTHLRVRGALNNNCCWNFFFILQNKHSSNTRFLSDRLFIGQFFMFTFLGN